MSFPDKFLWGGSISAAQAEEDGMKVERVLFKLISVMLEQQKIAVISII